MMSCVQKEHYAVQVQMQFNHCLVVSYSPDQCVVVHTKIVRIYRECNNYLHSIMLKPKFGTRVIIQKVPQQDTPNIVMSFHPLDRDRQNNSNYKPCAHMCPRKDYYYIVNDKSL